MFEPVIAGHDGPPYRASWERVSRGEIRRATLDHSIWFHRPFRADHLVAHRAGVPRRTRFAGLATARYFTVDGVLVASVAQEVALFVEPSAEPGSP
jgi:acyl-CoA thioesterase II